MTLSRAHARALGAVALIAVVFLGARYWLASTALLSETYYDEALTGLMGLAILHGSPQVFYWGQPYLGAIEAYVAAAGFWLAGPSGFVLRMAAVTAALFWAWSAWSLARRIAGDAAGLLAGLWIALPPVFLSFAQLSAHGQSISMTLGALVLAAGAALADERMGSRQRAIAWGVLGVAGGLGWWASQMMGMFLIAAGVTLVVVRPRVLRAPGPYLAAGLFTLTSLPFWVWNVHHDWATFRHLATWGEPPPDSWSTRVAIVAGTFLETVRGVFWDGRAVHLSSAVEALGGLVTATAYGAALGLALWQPAVWAQRLSRWERPWREPLDVVVVGFWLTVAAHLATWFGTSGVVRYSMTFYVTAPVLGAVGLARVARWPRGGAVPRVAATGVALLLLLYHGLTHGAFARDATAAPWRPVDAAIRELTALGVRACYADSRIAQVITFESAERIVCADYYGLRNFALLQTVDAVEDPAAVAIVTHRVLEGPAPPVMAEALSLIGARAQQAAVGDYRIFHHFRPPPGPARPIDAQGWRATASANAADAAKAFDRQVWTRWTAADGEPQWFELDLVHEHRLAGLTLETAPLADQAPAGLRVETSIDGKHWVLAAEDRDLLTGVHWWNGHPRVDDSGRVVVQMAPRRARYVRLVRVGAPRAGGYWSIGELFAYEAADFPWRPPPAASVALERGRRELAHWMDDPGGPHPRRAPVTYAHRRAQVAWARVLAAADEAIAAAPEWEEAHHLYGVALDLANWSPNWDELVSRSREDGAWVETLRWAELAQRQQPALWRSGRVAAQADALVHLGRAAEAAAVRAEAERRVRPAFRVRFGEDLELVRVEMPRDARPGTPVTVRCTWHALRSMPVNYATFVQVDGPGRFGHDHRLGEDFGTSAWKEGEWIEDTLVLTIPEDAPPGPYEVRAAVGIADSGKRLRVAETDRPHGKHLATVAALTIRR